MKVSGIDIESNIDKIKRQVSYINQYRAILKAGKENPLPHRSRK